MFLVLFLLFVVAVLLAFAFVMGCTVGRDREEERFRDAWHNEAVVALHKSGVGLRVILANYGSHKDIIKKARARAIVETDRQWQIAADYNSAVELMDGSVYRVVQVNAK